MIRNNFLAIMIHFKDLSGNKVIYCYVLKLLFLNPQLYFFLVKYQKLLKVEIKEVQIVYRLFLVNCFGKKKILKNQNCIKSKKSFG